MRIATIIAAVFMSSCVVQPVAEITGPEDAEEPTDEDADAVAEPRLKQVCLLAGKRQSSREMFCRFACPSGLKRQCWSAANQGGREWTNFCTNNFH
ncbi:hypothetical protein [Sorangium sp. So ce1000]|uniref:hypothetical protein n=1 Tax=Sorangium sp. So ce1000 TaxID=3133325 RepID=UPI003F5E0A52